jgi:hypothetical protein
MPQEAFYFLFPVLLVFLQTTLWHWQCSPLQARRGMFFGVRVEPDFISSATANSISKRFRQRIWLSALALAVVVAYFGFASRDSDRSIPSIIPMVFAAFAPMIGNLGAFGAAHRETRRRTVDLPGPSTRTAALFIEQEEFSPWLTVLDWLAILTPIGMPLVTAFLLILDWHQFPQNDSPLEALRFVLLTGVGGITAAGTCFALRFRARSADWASNPQDSRRYRMVLGLMLSGVLNLMIFDSCWLSLMPILKGGPLGNMETYFRFSKVADICAIPTLLTLRIYLGRKLARGSSDPMPDRCWKWGYFYHNPLDSALIVPLRSGTGFSFNHARPSVWVFETIGLAMTLAVVLMLFQR